MGELQYMVFHVDVPFRLKCPFCILIYIRERILWAKSFANRALVRLNDRLLKYTSKEFEEHIVHDNKVSIKTSEVRCILGEMRFVDMFAIDCNGEECQPYKVCPKSCGYEDTIPEDCRVMGCRECWNRKRIASKLICRDGDVVSDRYMKTNALHMIRQPWAMKAGIEYFKW